VSDLRIALVSEGPTDKVLIEAALKAVLPVPFILSPLATTATRPDLGGGWCGVFKWCREVAGRGSVSLETDPTLPGFDLFIVHVDADVADASYSVAGCCRAGCHASAAISRRVQPATALSILPKQLRINKSETQYRKHILALTEN